MLWKSPTLQRVERRIAIALIGKAGWRQVDVVRGSHDADIAQPAIGQLQREGVADGRFQHRQRCPFDNNSIAGWRPRTAFRSHDVDGDVFPVGQRKDREIQPAARSQAGPGAQAEARGGRFDFRHTLDGRQQIAVEAVDTQQGMGRVDALVAGVELVGEDLARAGNHADRENTDRDGKNDQKRPRLLVAQIAQHLGPTRGKSHPPGVMRTRRVGSCRNGARFRKHAHARPPFVPRPAAAWSPIRGRCPRRSARQRW